MAVVVVTVVQQVGSYGAGKDRDKQKQHQFCPIHSIRYTNGWKLLTLTVHAMVSRFTVCSSELKRIGCQKPEWQRTDCSAFFTRYNIYLRSWRCFLCRCFHIPSASLPFHSPNSLASGKWCEIREQVMMCFWEWFYEAKQCHVSCRPFENHWFFLWWIYSVWNY